MSKPFPAHPDPARADQLSNYELILVDNGSHEGSTHEYYAQIRKDPDLRILDYREPFNYSAANNLGRGTPLGISSCF